MSDLLIELSCMQDWPEHYFGAVFDCEENLKSILSICKHHIPRWETNGVFFCSESGDKGYFSIDFVNGDYRLQRLSAQIDASNQEIDIQYQTADIDTMDSYEK